MKMTKAPVSMEGECDALIARRGRHVPFEQERKERHAVVKGRHGPIYTVDYVSTVECGLCHKVQDEVWAYL